MASQSPAHDKCAWQVRVEVGEIHRNHPGTLVLGHGTSRCESFVTGPKGLNNRSWIEPKLLILLVLLMYSAYVITLTQEGEFKQPHQELDQDQHPPLPEGRAPQEEETKVVMLEVQQEET